MAQLITADYDKLVPNLSLFGTGFEQGTRISESMANREALEQQSQAASQLAGTQQRAREGDPDALNAVAGTDFGEKLRAFKQSVSEAEYQDAIRENEVLTKTALNALSIDDPTQMRLYLERRAEQFKKDGRSTKNIDGALLLNDADLMQRLKMQAEEGKKISDQISEQNQGPRELTNNEKKVVSEGLELGTPEAIARVTELNSKAGSTTNVTIGDAEVKSKLAQANLDLKNLQIKLNERKGSEFSDAQNKSAQFASIMVQAEKNIGLSLESGYDPTTAGQAALGVVPGGNVLRSEDSQIHKQAQEAWVRGKLRRESGAVIAPDEMDQEIKTFFPVFGDKPEVIKQKKRARDNATKAISAAAGGALTAIEETPVSRFIVEVME